jgi:hypothetical protein
MQSKTYRTTKKQDTVTTSTTKGELLSLAQAVKEETIIIMLELQFNMTTSKQRRLEAACKGI